MTGPPQTSSPRRSGVREVAVAFAATLLLTAAFDLMGRSVPFVRANLVTLVAAVFLWIPTVTLPRNGPGTEAYGLTFRGAVNGLRWGLGISLLTFVLFLPANHWWNTRVVGLEFAPDVGAYVHLPDRWYGEPAEPEPGVVHVFHQYEITYVTWEPETAPWSLEIRTDGRLRSARADGEGPDGASVWTLSGSTTRPVVAAFRTAGGSQLEIAALIEGAPVPSDAYALGTAARAPPARVRSTDGIRLPLGIGWIPSAILVQLLLVAFPEEFFYRGYLQRRLDETIGERRWRLGPVFLTRSILIVSAAFALGHLVIGYHPARLAVFFPALLFGFLRDRTDGIVAPVVYHAACNLMVQATIVHYV